jgi:hypothetical protein
MAEFKNEMLDFSSANSLNKIDKIFEYAKAKLQKVESNV